MASALLGSSCALASAQDVELVSAPLIYGDDDRRDVYETTNERWRVAAVSSTVALMPPEALQEVDGNKLQVQAECLGERLNLCPSERFREQPAAALCSGVLVGDSLVLTAAHCAALTDCSDQRWVFNYALSSARAAPLLEQDDVYSCRAIALAVDEIDEARRHWDYAFVELDRPVVAPRAPAAISSTVLQPRAAVSVIGYPTGLPAKVAAGANVQDVRNGLDFFTLNSDTFDSSSGSGVFDSDGMLLGVLVRGRRDYELQRDGDSECFAARRLDEETVGEMAEHASFVTPALQQLCDQQQEEKLCSNVPGRVGACNVAEPRGSRFVLARFVFALGGALAWLTRNRLARSSRRSRKRGTADSDLSEGGECSIEKPAFQHERNDHEIQTPNHR